MRKLFNAVFAGSMMLVGLWVVMTPSHAQPDYAKTEKKACTFCHPAGKLKELTDAGKYYKEHDHSLKGYEPPKQEKK